MSSLGIVWKCWVNWRLLLSRADFRLSWGQTLCDSEVFYVRAKYRESRKSCLIYFKHCMYWAKGLLFKAVSMWSGDNALVVKGKQERETEMETQRERTQITWSLSKCLQHFIKFCDQARWLGWLNCIKWYQCNLMKTKTNNDKCASYKPHHLFC